MTSDGVLLAIDAGGSVVKATIFDVSGSVRTTVSRAVPLIHAAPGFSERDMDVLWTATAACIRQALSETDGGAQRVLAIGLTAHGNGLYLVDGAGRGTRAAIMAADTRAARSVRQWISDGLEVSLQSRTWNGLWAGQPGPILSVLATLEPEVLAKSHSALSCKDYLWARLTGVVEVELSAASAGALYDSTAWAAADGAGPLAICEPAIEAFGLGRWRHLFPTPVASETVRPIGAEAADATGLVPGTPVVAGVVDNAAMQHGSGVFDDAAICVGAGTWSINQVLVPISVAATRAAQISPNAASIALSGMGLLCEASPTSASNLDWALNNSVTGVAREDTAQGLDIYVARLQREGWRKLRLDDPMFLPFIDGSRADSGARGAWVGLSSSAGEDELLGAVVEGVCLEHRRHIDRLQAALPSALPVRLSGGATKSEAWCQRFADVLGVPVEVSPVSELGSVCAAAISGVVAGVFTDIASGVAALNPSWRTFEPDPVARDFENDRYARYRQLATIFERYPWEG